jgi:hypothetical protein
MGFFPAGFAWVFPAGRDPEKAVIPLYISKGIRTPAEPGRKENVFSVLWPVFGITAKQSALVTGAL